MSSKIWTGALLFLAWLSFCAWLVLVCREKNVHPLRDFALFFIAMWIFASVKPGGEENGELGTGNGGGTNSVQQMVPRQMENVKCSADGRAIACAMKAILV